MRRTRRQSPRQGQLQHRLCACDQGRPGSLDQPSPVRATWVEVSLPRGWGKIGSEFALNQVKESRGTTTPLAKSTPSWLGPCLGQSHVLEGKPWCALLTRKSPGVQKQAAMRPLWPASTCFPCPLIPAVFLERTSKAARLPGAPLLGDRSPRPLHILLLGSRAAGATGRFLATLGRWVQEEGGPGRSQPLFCCQVGPVLLTG